MPRSSAVLPSQAERDSSRKSHQSKPTPKRRPRIYHPRIREFRERLNLTQTDVAAGTGLLSPVVHDAEHGREVTLKTAIALSRYFGVTVEMLWGINSNPNPKRRK